MADLTAITVPMAWADGSPPAAGAPTPPVETPGPMPSPPSSTPPPGPTSPATPLTPCGRGQYLLYHVNVPCSKSHKKTAICIFFNRDFNPASISTKSVLLYFCNLSNFVNVFTPSLRIILYTTNIYHERKQRILCNSCDQHR